MAKAKTNSGDFFCNPLSLASRDKAREAEDRKREGAKYQLRQRYVADTDKVYPVMLTLLKGKKLPRAEYLATYHAPAASLANSSGWSLAESAPDRISAIDRKEREKILELCRLVFTACLHAAVCDAEPDSAESTSQEWRMPIGIQWVGSERFRL